MESFDDAGEYEEMQKLSSLDRIFVSDAIHSVCSEPEKRHVSLLQYLMFWNSKMFYQGT